LSNRLPLRRSRPIAAETHKGRKLHKGTPFYFGAEASVLAGRFDEGFVLMHRALEEDARRLNQYTQAPAYKFVALKGASRKQHFRPYVKELLRFIIHMLEGYRINGARSLSYKVLRGKFLDSRDSTVETARLYFVFAIMRIRDLRELERKGLADKTMAPLVYANALMSLLLVIDTISTKWSGGKYFRDHTYCLAQKMGWTSTTAKGYRGDIAPDDRFSTNASGATVRKNIKNVISFKYVTKHSNRVLYPLERDFLLSWQFRNFSAHPSDLGFLWNNYAVILEAVMNSFFISVEFL